MEELRYALHAAADDPPPTRIDLDQLIDSTRRRTRLQYRVGAMTGAALLAGGAVLVPTLFSPAGGLGAGGPGGGAPPTCPAVPSGYPTAVPSESLGVVTGPTFDANVPDSSRRPQAGAAPTPSVAPDPSACEVPVAECATVQPSGPVTCDLTTATVILDRLEPALKSAMGAQWSLKAASIGKISQDGPNLRYVADLVLVNGVQEMRLSMSVYPHDPGDLGTICAGQLPAGNNEARCEPQAGGDVLLSERLSAIGPKGERYQVTDFRPDGSTVTVVGPDTTTITQLTTIARTPDLILVKHR